MKSFLFVNEQKLCYSDQGKGDVVVLLHGYLESLEIWNSFASELSKNYRVICFDIPGHGESDVILDNHNMEAIASNIVKALALLDVKKSFIVGHSMGGYVTLAIHHLFPEILSGFCLFHSHPLADTLETKKKRLREIDFVKAGKKDLIAKYNIPNAFANGNINLLKKEINNAIEIALQTSQEGIVANLNAMMNRSDLTEDLRKSELPFLYILGEKDNYIDHNLIIEKTKLPNKSELHILENSGHMGFIEEKPESLKIIDNFIKKHIKS